MPTTPPFTDQEFREALSNFATGVTIVTARDKDGEPVGMTASSFNSVSIDPPLVLWSVTKSALSSDAFKDARRFAIHVLSTGQTELSNRFARRGENKFGQTPHEYDADGVPILPDVATRFDCRNWAVYEGGDHWIIVGEVIGLYSGGTLALVFGQGAYSLSAPLAALSASVKGGTDARNEIRNLFQFQVSQVFHRLVVQFHDVVQKSGMTVEKWRIASSLYGLPSMPFDALAGEAHLEPAELETVLDEMVGEGLCEVIEEAGQRLVRETDGGRDGIRHLIALAKRQEENILSKLDDDQIETVKDALCTLIGSSTADARRR